MFISTRYTKNHQEPKFVEIGKIAHGRYHQYEWSVVRGSGLPTVKPYIGENEKNQLVLLGNGVRSSPG